MNETLDAVTINELLMPLYNSRRPGGGADDFQAIAPELFALKS